MEAKTIEQMPTQYDALNIEKEIYKFWEENFLFKADECNRCFAHGTCVGWNIAGYFDTIS